jgi:multidrug transporter EmrE-like cation transporter
MPITIPGAGQVHSPPVEGWASRRAWRVWVLVATAVAVLAKACAMERIPQNPAYHLFADHRTVLGVANGLNVLSNAAFAVVGLAGLRLFRHGAVQLRDGRERWPWMAFFFGVALTSLGSAWYHLAPSNDSLVWDRLPMAVGFMGLLAALIAERVDPRAGLWLLGPVVALGVGSVLYWHLTERAGVGDLRP